MSDYERTLKQHLVSYRKRRDTDKKVDTVNMLAQSLTASSSSENNNFKRTSCTCIYHTAIVVAFQRSVDAENRQVIVGKR